MKDKIYHAYLDSHERQIVIHMPNILQKLSACNAIALQQIVGIILSQPTRIQGELPQILKAD